MLDGLMLGFICYLSFLFSFIHFPEKIKTFLLKNFFITDIFSVITTFLLLSSISKSIMSVVGSIFCGLLVNISLMLYQKIND